MKWLSVVCVALMFAAGAALAFGAQVGSDGQVASFEAKLSPGALPRDHLAPVKIRVEGEFMATPENNLAQLRSLEIAVNRHGKLNTKGLPSCRMHQLEATTAKSALANCGKALLGKGLIRSMTEFPEQGRTHVKAPILVFNGRWHGGRGRVFLHIHGSIPNPFTVVIPIDVRRTNGTFGTIFFAEMPGFARRWAYLTKFRFVIGGSYWDEGKKKSTVVASCPAPKELNGALFPFARATYRFMTTKTLRTTLLGGCKVRQERPDREVAR
jgi:hypothetical protein